MKKITEFFTSNRVLLIISFLITVIMWITVSITYSDVIDVAIADVSIDFPFSESERTANLKAYDGAETKVKVTVTGKKYVVKQLNAESLVVTADMGSVTTSGNYNLKLSASKAKAGDYKIISVEPSFVNVTLDVEKTATFKVSIDCVGATVKNLAKNNESYILEPEFLSAENQNLTVTGPEKEISQITGAKAYANVNGELTSTTRYDADVMLLGENDAILFDSANPESQKIKHITLSYTKAPISANVLLRKTLPINYNAINLPKNVPLISVYEIIEGNKNSEGKITTIGVKGEPSVVEKLTEIKLDGTVDFSKIDLSNPDTSKFALKLPNIAGVAFEEYSSIEDIYFSAEVDTSNLSSKSFTIPAENIKIVNPPENKKVAIKTGIKRVVVIGSSYDLSRMNASDIVVTVDCTTATATTTLNPTFTVKRGNTCFVSGSYDVTVDIS
ncbi:MAG: hypothetical protein IJ944_05965 [Clostridia bacterium]|nr:hypothetical protein [Clostridia bacterium]